VAVWTAGHRVDATAWWAAWLPVVGGVVPALAVLLSSGAVPLQGIAVIPVAGVLIGGSMTGTALAGRNGRSELERRWGEVEAGLSIGLPAPDARLEVIRERCADALIPPLDQTRTVGLLTLPGAFVGVLLGGGSPLQAGITQLLVLVALLVVHTGAIALTTQLLARQVWVADPRREAAPAPRRRWLRRRRAGPV